MPTETAQRSEWRFSSRVLLPILVAGVATIMLVAGVLFLATRESDRVSSERQARLVQHVLADSFAKITHDQQSVTIWDETILRTRGDLDFVWLDANLGIWLHDYFGHDRTYVLNEQNKPIYGMMDGARADPSSYTTAYTALSPLVKRLREDMLAGKLPEGVTSPFVSNLVMIEARPAMASIVPILSDTGEINQALGTERLHVSIRFLDGTFLDFSMRQYLLKGARFAWNEDDIGSTEAGYPLRKTSGTVLGYFVWQPERPGGRVLAQTAPALGVAVFLVAGIICDDLIRELSSRLAALLGGADRVARLGGDEFAILQPNIESTGDVSALCERIIATVARPFELLGNSAFVGVSIGVAIAPESGVDRGELMRKADIALYRAKIEGRNRFRIFSEEMDLFIQRRRGIEQELREAIDAGGQLYLAYQPLYAAATTTPVGVEALLRWRHPRHGLISPAVFIPIAEESGLIHAIGDWVLREACTMAKSWPNLRIAVNVSSVQFRSPRFAAKVLAILKETGLEPRRLELEITESVLLDSGEVSALSFNTLRAAGVRLALDDFGTGYSSLTYLHKFPVDKIKIDRSFVQNIDSDAASDAIVQAMVDLARGIGVEVTAEGVETTEQRNYLAKIGCHELQGFLLSRPLASEQIDEMLADDLPREIATAA